MRHTIITPTSCTQHKRSNEASIALTELTVCASSCVQDHPPMWIIPLCLYLLMHWIIPLCLYFLRAGSSPYVDHPPMYLLIHWIIPLCLYFLCAESSPYVDHPPMSVFSHALDYPPMSLFLMCRIIPLCGSFPYVCIFSCTRLSSYVSISYVLNHPPTWITSLCIFSCTGLSPFVSISYVLNHPLV